MFKKLHLHMTFFCTLITGFILIAMTCISLSISEIRIRERDYTSFLENLNTLLVHFESQDIISHQWLKQMEANYHVRLRILDNDHPLFFQQLGDSPEFEPVFAQAYKQANTDHSFAYDDFSSANVLTKHVEFKMNGTDGIAYYSSVAQIPKKNGSLTVLTLYPTIALQHEIWMQRLLFGTADFAAIILLAIFSWHFTKRMIRPIRENRNRQVQFIAAASHELRSPLTVILTSLSAMKIADKEQADSFSDAIQSEGQRMSRLINDMLTLANADNRNWSIHPSDIELDTLLIQTFEKYEFAANKKGLSMELALPEEIPPACSCDAERIAQVLSILIDNAMSYTPKGGRICLGLKTDGTRAEIYVADNGPGVPDEAKKTIFDRFYRVDKAHKDKEHFGLGLCIAKEIVKLHKGKLSIKDTPGGGATFEIVIPMDCTEKRPFGIGS